jgi:hypothetical protein
MDPLRITQIGETIDVWTRQTSPVTATLASCNLIGGEPFTTSLSSFRLCFFSSLRNNTSGSPGNWLAKEERKEVN